MASYIQGDSDYSSSGGFGHAVASGGDFNGDGFEDVIVGAPFASYNSSSTSSGSVEYHGAVYVVFGGATPARGTLDASRDDDDLGSPHTRDGDSEALGSDGFAIFGAAANDEFGNAVALLGDVNGDGFDDVGIGAHKIDVGGEDSGALYILFGTESGFDDVYLGESLPPTMLAIHGSAANQYLGSSVRAAGDVDGDGLADVLVGTESTDAYLILGKNLGATASGAKATTLTDGTQNLAGTAAAEFLQGSSVANAMTAIGVGRCCLWRRRRGLVLG